mgnify:CR=1 FL=1
MSSQNERSERAGAIAGVHVFYHGKGCSYCSGTGYRERIGVYELLRITPETAGWEHIHFEVRRLAAGGTWSFRIGDYELAWVDLCRRFTIDSSRGGWSVVIVKPGGTGRPMRAISARLAPFPPRRERMEESPSVFCPKA